MFGAIAIVAWAAINVTAYLVAKKLDDAGDYKQPKGKHNNRYK